MLKRYSQYSYKVVGSYVLNYIEYFESFRNQISKADIDMTLPEYVSMLFFTVGIVSVSTFLFSAIILVTLVGLPGILYALFTSLVSALATILLFYLYPKIQINRRSSRIKDTLPFATMYLATLSGTGTSVPDIFKSLSEVGEYGEVSREAEKISRDIETFGMDVGEALEKAADRTPSEDFKELVWGINHIITTGGSMQEFLQEHSDSLMDDYQSRIEEFSETLSLMVEIYITVIIVGSIIFTSLSAVISSFSSSISPELLVNIQVFYIFIGMPIVSGMFIIIADGLSPGGIR